MSGSEVASNASRGWPAIVLSLLAAQGVRCEPPSPQALFVTGTVDRSGGAELDPFLILDSAGPVEAPRRAGAEFGFELLDAAGVVLTRADLDLRFEQEVHGEDGSEVRSIEITPFSLTVPLPPAARTARLLCGATVLAERARTAHAPVVKFRSLRSTDDGAVELGWQASDADGDALTFTVSYAADGRSFETVAIDLDDGGDPPRGAGPQASSLRVDLDGLKSPPGAGAALRVRASDGWNFSEATEPLP